MSESKKLIAVLVCAILGVAGALAAFSRTGKEETTKQATEPATKAVAEAEGLPPLPESLATKMELFNSVLIDPVRPDQFINGEVTQWIKTTSLGKFRIATGKLAYLCEPLDETAKQTMADMGITPAEKFTVEKAELAKYRAN